jgi:ribosomal protein S18 acetylase RimI-like enzyme
MPVDTQLEVLDLRHFSARQLRPLLEHEAAAWKRKLRWDYASSTELLLQYLDTRVLPGFVALNRGRICGFTFCVYEAEKAVIGDAYSLPDEPATIPTVVETLLQHLLQLLLNSPGVHRIEAQLLLSTAPTIHRLFAQHGFTIYPRLFLEAPLPTLPPARALLPPYIALLPWQPADYNDTAGLIHRAYVSHIDSQINDQYRSLNGSLRFLHNVVRFPGCGTFDPVASWILRDTRSGSLAAVALCSNVGQAVAHLTQLCVDPAYRGQALARELLHHTMAHLHSRGFQAVTLTVTEANQPAMSLYTALGFLTRHQFNAMVFEKHR